MVVSIGRVCQKQNLSLRVAEQLAVGECIDFERVIALGAIDNQVTIGQHIRLSLPIGQQDWGCQRGLVLERIRQ